MRLPDTSIIGTGGLGTTLTRALHTNNIPVKSVFNRTVEKANQLASEYDIKIASTFPTSLNQLGQLTFITVSDQAITDLARRLAKLDGHFKDRIFVHCSGNESADLLKSLDEKEAIVASFHPLQTFTTASSHPNDFRGIFFSKQGNEKAFPVLDKIANRLGAKTLRVSEEQKSHLHAAAVMASNYLTTLLDASVKIGSAGDLSESEVKQVLLPLVRTTLQNAGKGELAETLTGPIKRGDVDTVKKHLSLLKNKPELRELYSILGIQTVKLAQSSGRLDGSTAEQLRNILRQDFVL